MPAQRWVSRRRPRRSHAPARSLDRHGTGRARRARVNPVSRKDSSLFRPTVAFFAAHTAANCISLWDTASGRELAAAKAWPVPVESHSARQDRDWPCWTTHGRLAVFDRSTSRSRVLTSGSERTREVPFALLLIRRRLSWRSGGRRTPAGRNRPRSGTSPRPSGSRCSRDVISGLTSVFLPASRSLILMGGTRPRIWRLDPPSAPDALAGHTAEAWAAAFSPDGKVLATGSDDTKRAPDDQALGPGFRPALGGLESAHGHGGGARIQPRRTRCSPRGAWIPASRDIPT